MYSFVGVTSVTFAISIVFVLLFESPFMHLQKLLVGGILSMLQNLNLVKVT